MLQCKLFSNSSCICQLQIAAENVLFALRLHVMLTVISFYPLSIFIHGMVLYLSSLRRICSSYIRVLFSRLFSH